MKFDRLMKLLDGRLDRGESSIIHHTTVQQPHTLHPVVRQPRFDVRDPAYELHLAYKARQHGLHLTTDPLTPRFGQPMYPRDPLRFDQHIAYGDGCAIIERRMCYNREEHQVRCSRVSWWYESCSVFRLSY